MFSAPRSIKRRAFLVVSAKQNRFKREKEHNMANIPQGYKELPRSERKPLPNSRPVGPVDPNEPVEITVYLRAPATSNLANKISEQVQQQGRPMSRQENSASQSPSPDDLGKVRNALVKTGRAGLERSLLVEGSALQVQQPR